MIRRSTWYLVAIFVVVLGGAVYWQQRPPDSAENEPTPNPAAQPLFPVTSEELAGLQVQEINGGTVMLERDAGGAWELVQPSGMEADPAQVETKLSQLASLRVKTSLEPAADLSIFGLDSPAYRVNLSTTGGQEYGLAVGDLTPTGDGYYVQLNGNPPQVVNKISMESFLGILNEPPVLLNPEPEAPAGESPDLDE
jgi:hypothetical protein